MRSSEKYVVVINVVQQAGRSFQNLSVMSMKESVANRWSNRKVAIYKGLKVAVYIVNKTEISLSRSDLIELINVCILFCLLFYYFII